MMDRQKILAAWTTKLLAHPESRSGRVIRAFLVNPSPAIRRDVGLYTPEGVSEIADATLAALADLSDEARVSFIAALAALVK